MTIYDISYYGDPSCKIRGLHNNLSPWIPSIHGDFMNHSSTRKKINIYVHIVVGTV